MDNKAFFKLTYGLYIVSSHDGEKESGCVINTMTQVTAVPNQVCVTLNIENYTTELIRASKVLNVCVLGQDISMDTIRKFGFQSGRDINKFEDIEYEIDSQGVKYLTKNTVAMFSLRVNQIVNVGTHDMFICEVVDAQVLSDENVLTYADYHVKKNGGTPKSAPSYIEDTTSRGWVCDVCGFVYEGEELPADYICPICKVDASHFHRK